MLEGEQGLFYQRVQELQFLHVEEQLLADLVGAVNITLPDVGGASLGGAVLAFLGSLLARQVGDKETASFDPKPGKHARPE